VFLRLCLPPIRLSVTGSGRQRSDLIFRYSYALSLPLSLHRHLLSLDPALSDHPCGPVSRQRLRPSYSNYPPPPYPLFLLLDLTPRRKEKSHPSVTAPHFLSARTSVSVSSSPPSNTTPTPRIHCDPTQTDPPLEQQSALVESGNP
jgi:hypothetical protein